ncbi:MAG: hypothetical protein ACJAYP_001359 [Flavobacterium sp.]
MKIINFILSFYLILLSCIPCTDTKEDIAVNSTHEYATNHDNHSHETSNDACSPFCICNCCGQTILNYQPVIVYNFPVQLQEIKTINSNYNSSLIALFSGSIWQPPQIV